MDENMSKYIVLKKSTSGLPLVVKPSEVYDIIEKDSDGINKEWYSTVYHYDETQANQIRKNKSFAGISNVKTDKLYFDFDDSSHPENAKKDAQELCKRLIKQGIKEKDIAIYFSSNKGMHVILNLAKELNPRQVVVAAQKLAGDLTTFDTKIYDPQRILRVPWTKNEKSGLHKIPLTFNQLSLPIDKIKQIASNIDNVTTEFNYDLVNISEDWYKESKQEPAQAPVVASTQTIDFINKPRHWSDVKWALLNAHMIKPDERHEALMRIAATCKGLGYTIDMTRALCLTFDDKFVINTKKEPVEDLDSNILRTVFSNNWDGGTYSIKTDLFLQSYAKRVGLDATNSEEDLVVGIDAAFDIFKDYATNIDANTIKTGIPSLDRNLRMTIGMSCGLVGAPGSGKSTIALQMLNAMSKSGQDCIFFSYDMYSALVFQKLAQKHLNISDKELFQKFKNRDAKFEQQVLQVLRDEYKHVQFCFKTGQSPEEIERTIMFAKEKTGKVPRLIIVDYSELVLTDMSDMTASSAKVAQKLREIANKYNTCVFVLLQPNKMTGTPADEITSYGAAKGSSSIAQALSVMIGISRPGYDPKHPDDDQFVTINGLKNRMGSLFSVDLGWNGAMSSIYELSDEQRATLAALRKAKLEEKIKAEETSGWN